MMYIYNDKQLYNQTLKGLREEARNGGKGTTFIDIEGSSLYLAWNEGAKKCLFCEGNPTLATAGNGNLEMEKICFSEMGEDGYNYFRESLFERYPHLDDRNLEMSNHEEAEQSRESATDTEKTVPGKDAFERDKTEEPAPKAEQDIALELEEPYDNIQKEEPVAGKINAAPTGREESPEQISISAPHTKEETRTGSVEAPVHEPKKDKTIQKEEKDNEKKPSALKKLLDIAKGIGARLFILIERLLLGRAAFEQAYTQAFARDSAKQMRDEYVKQEASKEQERFGEKEKARTADQPERNNGVKVDPEMNRYDKAEQDIPNGVIVPNEMGARDDRIGKQMYFKDHAISVEGPYMIHAIDTLASVMKIPRDSIHISNRNNEGMNYLWVQITHGSKVLISFGISEAGNTVNDKYEIKDSRKPMDIGEKLTEVLMHDYSTGWRGAVEDSETPATQFAIRKMMGQMVRQADIAENGIAEARIYNVPITVVKEMDTGKYSLGIGNRTVAESNTWEELLSKATMADTVKVVFDQRNEMESNTVRDIESNGFFNGLDNERESFKDIVIEENMPEMDIRDAREMDEPEKDVSDDIEMVQ